MRRGFGLFDRSCNGLYMRGVAFFMATACSMVLADRQDAFAFATVFLWVFSTIDAVRQATLINLGIVQDRALVSSAGGWRDFESQLAAGIMLIGVGFVGLLTQVFGLNLEWLLQLWPLPLIALGGWLVWGEYNDRQSQFEDGPFSADR